MSRPWGGRGKGKGKGRGCLRGRTWWLSLAPGAGCPWLPITLAYRDLDKGLLRYLAGPDHILLLSAHRNRV